jgi:tetratricopeptide (TPR) repeat protein
MALLEMREGHMDAARKLYADSVKMDSQNYLAHYNFASMSMRDGDASQDQEIEASLRAAIRLNPRFGPAYDLLASLFGREARNLDEAAHLSAQAIQLEPGNLGYRVNAANVLMAMQKYADAATVLRNSAKLAKNPHESAMLQNKIAEIEEYQTLRLHAGNKDSGVVDIVGPGAGGGGQESAQVVTIVPAEAEPKHPSEAHGPKHEAAGVIRGVKCSYPSVIEFRVEGAKTVTLYNNNYYKLDFTTLGFTPAGTLRPCDQIEGMKARVQYAESADKTVDGQAITVELRK